MRTVGVATIDGRMPLYDAAPDGEPRGAVVVVQEAFGVNPHIEDVARRFASAGYRAVAPHLFYRTGDPALGYDDLPAMRPHLAALTATGLQADLDATLGYLDDAGFPPTRVAVVGFCMGGSVSLYAGTQHTLGAAVSFYGGGVAEGRFGLPPLVELAPALASPWLGLYGERDQTIPLEQVQALAEAAGRAGVPTELVRYPDAGHGFHCDARPQAYHEAAARDGWSRTLDWLDRHFPTDRG